MISVSFFLTSSTSLFSTEPITDNNFQLPELTPPKNNESEQASKARQANLTQWGATSAAAESPASACTSQPKAKAQSPGQRMKQSGQNGVEEAKSWHLWYGCCLCREAPA